MPCELDEIVKPGVQDGMNARELDAQVAVNEDVPETRHRAEPTGELEGEDPEVPQHVDGGRVLGCFAPGARRQMGGDVQGVLRAQLQPTLHRPLGITVGRERVQRPARVAAEALDGCVEREQVTSDNRGVGLAWTQRPKRPASIRARCAVSIFASWTA